MQRKLLVASVAVAVAGIVASASAQHAGSKKKSKALKRAGSALPLCPVKNQPVDFSIKLVTEDGPVYFCCKPCVEKYRKNPAKYAKGTQRQRKALAAMKRIQVSCPVSGKPISSDTYVETREGKVYFCCAGCVSKYKADPAKYRARLADSYTYQTVCPVMGEEIDPSVYTDLPDGTRVYFCCEACIGKFREKPHKFAGKLRRQGVNIDVDSLRGAGGKRP